LSIKPFSTAQLSNLPSGVRDLSCRFSTKEFQMNKQTRDLFPVTLPHDSRRKFLHGLTAAGALGATGAIASQTFISSALAAVSKAAGTAAPADKASGALPRTMRAVQFAKFGEAKELQIVVTARPMPTDTEVLVRVHAAGINPVDWKVRNGEAAALVSKFPVTPGYDIAGEIVQVGRAVKSRSVGERVFAMLPLTASGAYAEYAVVPEALVAAAPKNASMIEAAALPLAALTALQGLFEAGNLRSGQRVLIHGAAGGVGHLAVQMARSAGATVFGTAGASNQEFLRKLGATPIDYRSTKFEDVAKDMDLVFDTIGGDTLKRSYAVIRSGGTIVSLLEKPDAALAKARSVRSGDRVVVRPSGSDLRRIAAMVEAGSLKVEVAEVAPVTSAVELTQKSESGRTRGKLVLDLIKT
jgi:NADPH:quinone reductase-like Zn-dependent oxidoreductase